LLVALNKGIKGQKDGKYRINLKGIIQYGEEEENSCTRSTIASLDPRQSESSRLSSDRSTPQNYHAATLLSRLSTSRGFFPPAIVCAVSLIDRDFRSQEGGSAVRSLDNVRRF
jgi:hypothetical protein